MVCERLITSVVTESSGAFGVPPVLDVLTPMVRVHNRILLLLTNSGSCSGQGQWPSLEAAIRGSAPTLEICTPPGRAIGGVGRMVYN